MTHKSSHVIIHKARELAVKPVKLWHAGAGSLVSLILGLLF